MVVKFNSFLKKLPSFGGLLGRVPLLDRLRCRFSSDEKGVTLVYVALSLPVILGFAGIGIDIAVWNLDKRESQAMADAAAMSAGVSVMRSGNFATINTTALTGATENGFGSAGVVAAGDTFTNARGETITINNPPSVGPRSAAVWGDPDGDGIDGDTNAIEVFVRRPAPVLFSSIILTNTNQFVQSRTVVNAINDPGENCFMALDPDGGITLNGGSTVNLDCGVLTNGDLVINGGGGGPCLIASQVHVAGDYDDSETCVDPAATPSITRPDPLRFLPEVDERGCDINGVTSVATVKEFYPRSDGILVFCRDVSVQPPGTLIFHPGVYVFHQGASLDVLGTLDASEGVMFYFTEDAGLSNPGPFRVIASAVVTINALEPGDLDGNDCNSGSNNNPPGPTLVLCSAPADIDQADPADGSDLDEIYEGIAFFQDRDAKAANGDVAVSYDFSGDSNMLINGVMYLPGGDVTWAGGSAASVNAILSDSITVSGNADFGTIEGTILESLLAFVFIKIIE